MSGLKVVVSSTARDLPEHRAAVMAACQSQDVQSKMMEYVPASDTDAIRVSLALVDDADIYIGIFGLRYGYQPDGYDISITEMEYNRAAERSIPRLIFLSHDEHPFTRAQVDTGPAAEKLERLRARLQKDRVVKYFSSPESLRAAVSEALAKLLRERKPVQQPVQEAQPPTLPRPEDNPYRNLAAFHEEDAAWYFGREQLARDTLARFYGLAGPGVRKTRLLTVIGPSGSGKSSFARAGLMARIRKQHVSVRALATLRPGVHPMAALLEAVTAACGEASAAGSSGSGGNGSRSPLSALPRDRCQSLVILVDQFEEVWSQCEDETERANFIDALLDAGSRENGPVSVLLTLRSDFLAQTQRHPRLNAIISEQSVLVPAMSADNLRAAIAEPAKRAGYPLDEEAIGQLIDETLGKEGALPLLQFALSRIWQGIAAGINPRDTLQHLGGVGGALAREAESVYSELDEREQAIARRAFLSLVQLGEGVQDTRRRVPLGNLLGGASVDEVDAVLERFTDPDRRLLTRDEDGVEVTHEALFMHWHTLRNWLDEGREDIRLLHRLEADCADGLLWRPPLLTLLQDFYRRQPQDLSPDQLALLQASEGAIAEEKAEKERAEQAALRAETERREAAEKLFAEQRSRARQLRWIAAGMSLLALLALVAVGLLSFSLQHGLTPTQAMYALRLRSGLATPPLPTMVPIEPGSFERGPVKRNEGEGRSQIVKLPGFKISAHEITFEQYDAYAKSFEHPTAKDSDRGRGKHPVINVSWEEARAYTRWLSFAEGQECGLPTEAEWEYAARAGTTKAYALPAEDGGSDDIVGKGLANCEGCGEWDKKNQTAPVGLFKKPNAWGLYDVHGNVWEWVEDCWHDSYTGAPEDGSAWGDKNGGDCSSRVARSGSWRDSPGGIRADGRLWFGAGSQFDNLGFRVVCRPQGG